MSTSRPRDSARAREAFARQLARDLDLRSSGVGRAFARVPRESFVGPGPWWVSSGSGYLPTPDADPAHLYGDVRIALDPTRELNNGRPYTHARWLDALAPAPGAVVVQVGAGTGYYTAILAELVGPEGRVTAIEVDRQLANAARTHLAPWRQVSVLERSAVGLDPGEFDAAYWNAGSTQLDPIWLDRLRPGGAIVVPLTVERGERFGAALCVRRGRGGFSARFLEPEPTLLVFSYVGGRDPARESELERAFARGGHLDVRSLRRDAHAPGSTCWLHRQGECLSRELAKESVR